jgi:hypothetical protein
LKSSIERRSIDACREFLDVLRDAKRALDTVEDEVGSLRMSCDAMNARIQGNPKIAFPSEAYSLALAAGCLFNGQV